LDGSELEEKYREAVQQRSDREPRTRERSSSDRVQVPAVPDEVQEEAQTEEAEAGEVETEEVEVETHDQARPSDTLPDVPGPESEEEPDGKEAQFEDAEIIEEAEEEADHSDRVDEVLERYRCARHRLEVVKEETGEEVEEDVSVGGLVSQWFGRTKTKTTTERTEAEQELLQRCREEVGEAKDELRRVLDHRQVEHDHDRA
jgi:hypothetical protein